MTATEAVQALSSGKRREVRVGAREHTRVLAELKRDGFKAVSAPVRVGGLIVARTIRRV